MAVEQDAQLVHTVQNIFFAQNFMMLLHIAAARENEDLTQTYEGAFIEHSEMAKLSIVEAPEALDMPDPEQVRAAVEMMMQTMFDVLRDTRMEAFATDLAWGFANSFHVVAKRIEGREDDAAKKLGDL